MRLVTSVKCLALVMVVAACSESTTVASSALVGAWMSPRENLQPTGSMTKLIAFSESGTFNYRVNSYGLYSGPSDLSAYTQVSGVYSIDGDKLLMTANRIATWDSFYGAGSKETVEQVNTTVFDQARFRIVGGTLVLDYITYPADAPVPTTQSFNRLGLD